MKVVCLPDAEAERLVQPLPANIRTVIWDGVGPPPEEHIAFLVPGYSRVRARPLPTLADLEVVQLTSAGLNGWDEVLPDGVTLCNGRGVHGRSTAELAVAGLLAVLRDLPLFMAQQRAAVWERRQGNDLDERRVLIIGAGDIGLRIKAAVEVFGADVTMVARTPRPGVRVLAELPELLPRAEVVALAVPETPGTAGLVDARFLAALPDGAVLVNVSRGSVVVTDDLIVELNRGRIKAFLDVADPEPLPSQHPLWTAPNVIITPHVGGGTMGWQRRAFAMVRDQIERYASGQPLLNVVTGEY